jgi:hypothetical protein
MQCVRCSIAQKTLADVVCIYESLDLACGVAKLEECARDEIDVLQERVGGQPG